MPECGNAKLFEVLGGEAREDPLVILLSRNASSYSSRPRLRSQTTMSMTARLQSGVALSSAGEARVSRVALGFSGLRKAR